jgi:hypothetical protein
MAITNIYSKRKARLEGKTPDVFVYDKMPKELRVQLVYVLRVLNQKFTNEMWGKVHDDLAEEYGMEILGKLTSMQSRNTNERTWNFFDVLSQFVITVDNVDRVLDVVEYSFCVLKLFKDKSFPILALYNGTSELVGAINTRFLEHGVGYRFENGRMLRVDSQWIHKEGVIPALSLLQDSLFKGANDEFLSAHEHYRHGRHEECLIAGCKAFESTMKAICRKRGWAFDENAPAKKLIHVCLSNGLFPPFMEEHLNALVKTLESGVPTPRNKLAGHGQGTEIRDVPQHYASYCLHLTASNILFLAKCDEELK